MADLSPAALAVWHAYATADCDPYEIDPRQAGVAAALRAAVDQVVPKDKYPSSDWTDKDEVRYQLLAIAAELDDTPKQS